MKANVILASLMAALLAGCATSSGPSTRSTKSSKSMSTVQRISFGKTPEGEPVDLYVLANGRGTMVKVMTYGGIITELIVPDRDGAYNDVVLGFDNLEGYLKPHPYFGAIVGRYANRIAQGKFALDGVTYNLATNNPPNHLHGGVKGFDKVVWKAEVLPEEGAAVRMSYLSKDGEEGYPGNLEIQVTYTLTAKDELQIVYSAKTDKATPINLSNHSYFNLAGPETTKILTHELMLNADAYTPVDETLIPTGEIKPVAGTPMDFRKATPIGSRIALVGNNPTGYDHNYVLNKSGNKLTLVAKVTEKLTGRIMEVYSTEPGVQFYTGNFLDGSIKGKKNVIYQKHQAFCLETQHFPDSVNQPSFPSVILQPGQTYSQTTVYKFIAK